MWWEAQGDWARAHAVVQSDAGQPAAWVRGYLHRVEGDLANADYWYRGAGRGRPELPLATEWAAIAAALTR